jgi:uncharacterized membrane protein
MLPMQTIYHKLLRPGQIFFAIALVGFGILQLIYGDIVIGRAPAYPPGVPGQYIFACIWGAAFVVVAVLILGGRREQAWIGLIVTAFFVFVWAFLRQLPTVFANPNGSTITALGKAIALFGGTLAVAASIAFSVLGLLPEPPKEGRELKSAILNAMFLGIGTISVGGFLILGGVEHFIYPQFVATLVPSWIPFPVFWTYFAGIALILGGLGIVIPFVSKINRPATALSGLMIFLWVFMLHLPRAITAADAASQRNEWTAVFEALAISGIAFAIAGLPGVRSRETTRSWRSGDWR